MLTPRKVEVVMMDGSVFFAGDRGLGVATATHINTGSKFTASAGTEASAGGGTEAAADLGVAFRLPVDRIRGAVAQLCSWLTVSNCEGNGWLAPLLPCTPNNRICRSIRSGL